MKYKLSNRRKMLSNNPHDMESREPVEISKMVELFPVIAL